MIKNLKKNFFYRKSDQKIFKIISKKSVKTFLWKID